MPLAPEAFAQLVESKATAVEANVLNRLQVDMHVESGLSDGLVFDGEAPSYVMHRQANGVDQVVYRRGGVVVRVFVQGRVGSSVPTTIAAVERALASLDPS